jgi:hypothetical protein
MHACLIQAHLYAVAAIELAGTEAHNEARRRLEVLRYQMPPCLTKHAEDLRFDRWRVCAYVQRLHFVENTADL